MTEIITPSRPDFWHGTNTGKELTVEQLTALTTGKLAEKVRGFRRRGGMETFAVRKLTEPKRLEEIAREVVFVCPVTAIRRDFSAVAVIAPNGMETWVAFE